MFELSTYAILMLVGFFVLLMIGIPVAISLATVGFVFGWLGFGDGLFNLLHSRSVALPNLHIFCRVKGVKLCAVSVHPLTINKLFRVFHYIPLLNPG